MRNCFLQCFFVIVFYSIEGYTDDVTPVKDITFKLQNEEYFTRQISHGTNAKSLKIGSRYEKDVANSGSIVLECSFKNSPSEYKDVYKPKVSTDDESSETDCLLDYFVLIKKEVWECKTNPGDATQVSIVRVVNELIGRKEISEIKYVDGIEISTKSLLGESRTALVREIKYYDPADQNVVRFGGKLKIKPTSESTSGPRIAQLGDQKYLKTIETLDDGYIKEVQFKLQPGDKRSSDISNEGKTITLGSFPTQSLGDKDSKYKCTKPQGVSPFPSELRPRVGQNFTYSGEELTIALEDDQIIDMFAIIKEEIWICKSEHTGTLPDFYRIVSDLISTEPIKKVEYSDGVTGVWDVNLKEGSKGVRFTEINYVLRGILGHESIKYLGKLLLMDQERLPISTANVQNRDLQFNLENNRIYRRVIGEKGFSLQIGSHWVSEVGDKDTVVECKQNINGKPIDYLEEYLTKFRLVISSNGKFHREHIRRVEAPEYFEYISRKVWNCSNDHITFLRIVNQFKGLGEFYDVEHYDGVELYNTFLENGKKSLKIQEIKYLHLDTYEVLKYEGKLSLITEPGVTARVPIELKNKENEILKTDNDIFWAVGSFRDFFLGDSMKDFKTEVAEESTASWETKMINSKGIVMDIGALFESKVGDKKDTAECKKLNNNEGSNFKIKAFSMKDEERTELGDREREMIFKVISQEVWECAGSNEKEEYQFYKVADLIEIFPDNIKNIHYVKGNKVWFRVKNETAFVVILQNTVYLSNDMTVKGYDGLLKYKNDKSDRISGTTKFPAEKFGEVPVSGSWRNDYSLDQKRGFKYVLDGGDSLENSFILGTGPSFDYEIGNYRSKFVCEEAELPEALNMIPKFSFKDGRSESPQFDAYFLHPEPLASAWNCSLSNVGWFYRIRMDFKRKFDFVDDPMSEPPRRVDRLTINDITHYEGLKINMGSTAGFDDWAFSEVIYKDSNDKLIKYEGFLREKDTNELGYDYYKQNLQEIGSKEMNYFLKENELFHFNNEKEGAVIQFGKQTNNVFAFAKVDCQLLESTSTDDYTPTAMIARMSSEHKSEFRRMDKEQFNTFFESLPAQSEKWECTTKDISLYREVHLFKVKSNVARIFYHEGVKVERMEDHVKVEEIIYRSEDSMYYYKFNGVVTMEGNAERKTYVREMQYLLDKPRIFYKRFDHNGIAMRIGSRWEETVGKATDKIICEMKSDDEYNDEYRMIVHINTLDVESKRYTEQKLDMKTYSQYFKFMTQEVWSCNYDQTKNLHLIINELEAKVPIGRIFYEDGIFITSRTTFDGEEIAQVRELKYIDPVTFKVLKFEGGVLLSRGRLQLTEGPPSKSTGDGKASKDNQGNGDATEGASSTNADAAPVLDGITYTKKGKQVSLISDEAGKMIAFGEIIEVGTKWEEGIGSKTDSLTCILDARVNKHLDILLPEILISHAGTSYKLDSETFENYFDVKSFKVWICYTVGTHRTPVFLRVMTEFVAKQPVQHVTHYDGIQVEKIKVGNDERVKIVELKYLDKTLFKPLKYEGKLLLEEKMVIDELKSDPNFKDVIVSIDHLPRNLILPSPKPNNGE